MTEAQSTFAGSIPEHYERYMRPTFFEPYAEELSGRLQGGEREILELACGTGILTRRILGRMAPTARLTATDLNPPMLAEAQRRLDPDPRLLWRQADMMALPFEDASFDLALCQFGYMFPPDKGAAFREARRILRPGGALLFNVWASLEENPANPATLDALKGLFPDDPPTFLRVPFGFHDAELIAGLLRDQGFEGIFMEAVTLECRADSALDLAQGLVRGTPLANDLQARGADPGPAVAAVAASLEALGGRAPFRSTMKALVVRAQAPAG